MLFAFHCFDHPESTALRQRTRADHLAYLDRLKDGIVLAGALLADDGATPCGSLLVLDLPDRAAAELKDGIVLAGALLADDGATPCGSLLVLDLPDRAAAEAFASDDPYARAGLFARVEIQPFHQARPIRPG